MTGRGVWVVLAAVLAGGVLAAVSAGAGAERAWASDLQPTFGLRVRQEIMPNVYWFDPVEQDRNWIRVRTRAGLRWYPAQGHTLEVRLANEFRKIITPSDVDFDLDEVIIDRLAWSWRNSGAFPFILTLGRQDVIWNDGFLVLEGHPFDGSRTMYQNALRFVVDREGSRTELVAIVNPKRDPIALVDDEDRALSEADETAVALRREWTARDPETVGYQAAAIWKHDEDPDHKLADLTTWTAAGRVERRGGTRLGFLAEVAAQYQDGRGTDGWAFAFQTDVHRLLGHGVMGQLGYLHYSGRDGGLESFIPPYGRWPKWSELYLYTLIGDGGVALWHDMSGPRIRFGRVLNPRASVRATGTLLFSPANDWARRGTILEILGSYRVNDRLNAHLLWEWLHPGTFPAGQEDDAHFIRWQLEYEIK